MGNMDFPRDRTPPEPRQPPQRPALDAGPAPPLPWWRRATVRFEVLTASVVVLAMLPWFAGLLVASAIKNWMSTTGGNKIISGMSAAGAGVLILDGERSDGPIVDSIRAVPRSPGRGELVYPKGGRQVIQVATVPLPEGYSPDSGRDQW